MSKVIFWDFHGTLARLEFEKAMQMALDDLIPGNDVTRREILGAIEGLFPWDMPSIEHPHYEKDGVWWEENIQSFIYGFARLGFVRYARELAHRTREIVLDPKSYYVLPYAEAALHRMSILGWRNIILSNHIPELGKVVAGLPFGRSVEQVITSGVLAYEKPHHGIFEYALEKAGHPEEAWMVGDTVTADILGAQACGIPAILVHNSSNSIVRRHADKLTDVADIIDAEHREKRNEYANY